MDDILKTLIKAAYNAIFNNIDQTLPPGITFNQTSMKSFKVRDANAYLARRAGTNYLQKITCDITDGPDIFLLTFLEQNPFKNSIFGARAKKGAKIMWVIGRNVKTSHEKWLGRMEDGAWYPK